MYKMRWNPEKVGYEMYCDVTLDVFRDLYATQAEGEKKCADLNPEPIVASAGFTGSYD